MTGKWQLKDHEAEKQLFTRRLAVAAVIVALLFSALIVKLLDLQVVQYEYFSARSDGNRLHSQYVPPARGLIFDSQGELLADNQPIFNLTIVKEQVEDLDSTLAFLATLIRLSDDDIAQFQNRLNRNRVPFSSVTLRYLLSEEEKARVAVNSHQLSGVAIESQFVRSYPLGSLTAHSVGYVSEINREEMNALTDAQKENYGGTYHMGKSGVERTYEALLHGTVGYEIVEKNNRGQIMRRLDRTDPVAGKNLTLHLNAKLQMAAEQALGDFRGAVVAIEPATGGILAMVSKPGFDPNLFVTGISNKDYSVLVNDVVNTPLFDRSTNPYPPGSTVKPFIGLAGLQSGTIDYEFTIQDPGYFRLPGVSYRWVTTRFAPPSEVVMGRQIYKKRFIRAVTPFSMIWVTALALTASMGFFPYLGSVTTSRLTSAMPEPASSPPATGRGKVGENPGTPVIPSTRRSGRAICGQHRSSWRQLPPFWPTGARWFSRECSKQ